MTKRKVRILIVDDEKIIRDFFGRLLSLMGGVEVFLAEDGYKAIEMVKTTKFDLFFIDVRMPGINGLDTYRQIRRMDADAVAVMITGYAVEDLLQQAKDEGAYGAIRKPFDISEIKDVIAKVDHPKTDEPMRVLIVDDEESIQHFFLTLMKEKKALCIQARTKAEAFAALKQGAFDLVFLDLVLKNESGAEIYEELKKIAPQTSIVLITGYPQKADEIKNEAGISGCLYKPFDLESILKYIAQAQEKIK